MVSGLLQAYASNLKAHWRSYALGTMAMLVTSISEVLMPKFIQWALDLLSQKDITRVPKLLQSDSLSSTLNVLTIVFIGSLTAGWMGRIGWRQLLARRTHVAGHVIKTKFWSVLKDQPLAFFQRYPLGDLMNRATGDWNKSRFIHGFTMVLTFDVIFFSLLAIASMLMIDVGLTLACLAIVPFLPRPIIRLSKREYHLHQKAQETLSKLSDSISQSVSTVRMQRSTASEQSWLARLNHDAAIYADQQFQVLKTSWKIFIVGAAPTVAAYGVLFTFGLHKYQSGAISLGEFIAMQSYVLLLQSPLFELGSVISEWQTGFASFQRILEIFQQEKTPKKTSGELNTDKLDKVSDILRVEALSFEFDPKHPVLRDVQFAIKRGEKIGIRGRIGAGKSTLVQIIAGIQEGYEGRISLFGSDLHAYGRDVLSERIGLIPQKPFLFAGSIRSNLNLDQDISEADMVEVLKAVQLWNDVKLMPQGLDTWIGEWGINLSGGQKQRLAIARALLRPTDILILDDCLSAVDSITEEKILASLKSRVRNQTIIWTAHRASTLQLCDRIFHLQDGCLRVEKVLHSQNSNQQSTDSCHQAEPSAPQPQLNGV